MISHISFLQKARALLIELVGKEIIKDTLDEIFSQLHIVFKSGLILYIRYNEYKEYGYQIIFSTEKNDFSRFDNFDDKWDVSTKPHHHHIKGSDIVIASSMIGEPTHDIPLLVAYLKKEIKDL